MIIFYHFFIKISRNPGLNQEPLDLQSNALPTELLRLLVYSWINNFFVSKIKQHICDGKLFTDYTFPYLQTQYILKIEKFILYTKKLTQQKKFNLPRFQIMILETLLFPRTP